MKDSKFSADLALRVLELVAQGRIDKTDARIMSAMLEWPRPSNVTIAKRLGISERVVRYRRKKCRELMS